MSPSYLLFVFFALCSIAAVLGDIYLQHPPGNNNRFQEEGDRQTATRLFNSQNNARGGYCWGGTMNYYEGSILAVEWTNQHSCGIDNNRCEVVLQYMCGSETDDETLRIRDGRSQTRISTNADPTATDYYNRKVTDGVFNGEFLYGMNEPYSNYKTCIQRQRNKGLWISTETPGDGNGAMATRQNAGGTQYGFECTEERDHYPYWHPSMWKDIAVWTNDKSRCSYYKSESQNVKAKNYCANITDTGNGKTPNNEQECARNNGQWVKQDSWGIDAPECKETPRNRDNHLGNGVGVHSNSYNWTLPRTSQEDCIKNGNCTCILRIRYNITVGEVPFDLDWRANGRQRTPVRDNTDVPYMGSNFTITINDNQAARTFQDRSYMFRIVPRPSGVPTSATIYNLNVRGKRGNIVQNYPAVEYDFVPTFLTVTQNDYIHFQWTGCDKNPDNRDGQGRDKTDRSNIVQIKDMSRNFPLNETEIQSHRPLLFKDAALRKRMAMIDQQNCLSREELEAQAGTVAVEENPQNCALLNAAPSPHFTGAVVKMTETGFFAYMSTRNNNFSNRSQKGSINVVSAWKPWMTAVVVVGGVVAISAGAAVGTVFYAKRHPLSRVAEVVHKVPGFSKV